ncbi:unnamed protein product, partial [Staurois parvus]
QAAARSEISSWVPVRPPIAGSLQCATLCQCALSGLLTHCWCVTFFDIGVLRQITGPHIAAARPLICHGPLYTASS